ncbi:MAG: VOC family protein [Pseudomonadales bacterium]
MKFASYWFIFGVLWFGADEAAAENREVVAGTRATKSSFDHTVIVVRDLQAAAAKYRSFGFNTAPTMHHNNFSTSNNLIMFQHNFLELLGTRAQDETTWGYSRFLAEREGMFTNSMFSEDALADHKRLSALQLAGWLSPRITRPVPMPDGSNGEVMYRGFTVPLAEAPRLAVFFTHQMRPQYIWVPDWMVHPNGARRIVSVTFVADNPVAFREYYEGVVGDGSTTLFGREALRVTMGRGTTFEVLTPNMLPNRFADIDVEQDTELRNHGVAVTVAVESLAKLRTILLSHEVVHHSGRISVRIPPNEAHGIALEFVEE